MEGESNMNNLSHIIRNFNRFELKYLVTLRQAEHLKNALDAYLVPDDHGRNNGKYALTSLYYDSPDLRCYHEKVDGIRFRRKLRIRHYETGEALTDETPVFVEIKQRVDRVTQKRRAVLSYGDALRLCNDRQLPEGSMQDKAVLDEVFVFLWQYNLRPVSIVRYDRQAFIGTKFEPGLRVTFDTSLSSQSHPLHIHETPCGLSMLPLNWVVMEIKVNERIPYWLTELIAAHNLQLIRISKYCRSIEAAQSVPHAGWYSAVPESSWEVLASSPAVFHVPEAREGARRNQQE
jgi:hypothetical protein